VRTSGNALNRKNNKCSQGVERARGFYFPFVRASLISLTSLNNSPIPVEIARRCSMICCSTLGDGAGALVAMFVLLSRRILSRPQRSESCSKEIYEGRNILYLLPRELNEGLLPRNEGIASARNEKPTNCPFLLSVSHNPIANCLLPLIVIQGRWFRTSGSHDLTLYPPDSNTPGSRPYFFFLFAQRAFCAREMRLRPAAESLLRLARLAPSFAPFSNASIKCSTFANSVISLWRRFRSSFSNLVTMSTCPPLCD